MKFLKKIPKGFHDEHVPLKQLAKELKLSPSLLGSVIIALNRLPAEHKALELAGKVEAVWTRGGAFLPNSSKPGLKKLFSEFEISTKLIGKMRASGIVGIRRFPAFVEAGHFGEVPFISASKVFLVHKSIHQSEEFNKRRMQRDSKRS